MAKKSAMCLSLIELSGDLLLNGEQVNLYDEHGNVFRTEYVLPGCNYLPTLKSLIHDLNERMGVNESGRKYQRKK